MEKRKRKDEIQNSPWHTVGNCREKKRNGKRRRRNGMRRRDGNGFCQELTKREKVKMLLYEVLKK